MNNEYIKASSDYAFNYVEHLTAKKTDATTVLSRLLIIFITTVICLALILIILGAITFPVLGKVSIPYFGVLIPFVIIFANHFWKNTKTEYEYLIVSGTMSMDKIIGSKKRRQMIEFKVPSAEHIMPYKKALEKNLLEGAKIIVGASSLKDDDIWCAVFKNENGEKKALVFNATEKSLKLLRYYNKNCIISE